MKQKAAIIFYTAFIVILFLPTIAFALTVMPPAPLGVYSNIAYYMYYYSGFLSSEPVMDKDYRYYDFRVTQQGAGGAPVDSATYPNMLLFDVKSTQTFTVTDPQKLVITIYTTMKSTGESPKAIPIAWAGDGICADQVNCQYKSAFGGKDYLYSARYTQGSTLRIGIYPQDICRVIYGATGKIPNGCDDDGEYTAPVTGTATVSYLTFYAGVATDGASLGLNSGTVDSLALNISSQASIPAAKCDSMDKAYFPGDGEIALSPSAFGSTVSAGSAPVTHLVVLGRDGADPETGTGFWNSTKNAIIARYAIGGQPVAVGGFSNTTNGNDYSYTLWFSVKDAAGVVAPFASNCRLADVKTSSISGYLSKSNCFIATAAFGSAEAGPVRLLRGFRDAVLSKSGMGRSFVLWYYSWSPGAAAWLLERPVLRLPVLWLLVPLEIAAWLALNFWCAAALALAGCVLLVWSLSARLRKKRAVAALLMLVTFVVSSGASASSSTLSGQPYIEKLKEAFQDEEPPPDAKVPYTERLRKKIGEKDIDEGRADGGGNHIERIKKTNPDEFAPQEKPAQSYTEKIKNELEPPPADGAGGDAASAIQSFKDGRSGLRPRKRGRIRHAVGFKIGTVMTREIKSGSSAARQFTDMYGAGWTPDVTLFYELQPLRSELYGNIGIVIGGGIAYNNANGQFQFNLENAGRRGSYFGTTSPTKFQFFTVPVFLGASYRFHLLRYVRPYVQACPALVGYLELRHDQKSGFRGYSKGAILSGGMNFLLDWIFRREAWDMYADFEVKHYYLTADYTRLFTFASDVNFSVYGLSLGLSYEF